MNPVIPPIPAPIAAPTGPNVAPVAAPFNVPLSVSVSSGFEFDPLLAASINPFPALAIAGAAEPNFETTLFPLVIPDTALDTLPNTVFKKSALASGVGRLLYVAKSCGLNFEVSTSPPSAYPFLYIFPPLTKYTGPSVLS